MTMLQEDISLSGKLAIFGLNRETALLYMALLKMGPCGIVALTRRVSLGRNVVYRLLADLERAQLVSVARKSFGKEYAPVSPLVFEGMIARREAETSQMRGSLALLVSGLQALAHADQPSKIVHYEGVEGLKQVNWNLTRAKKEFKVFELEPLSNYLDSGFAEKLRRIWVEKGITTYDITNRKSIVAYTSDLEYWREYSKYRYIEPSVLAIKFEMFIYNDVVTLLDYKTDAPHAVEIYNQALADMQRQLFDAIWLQAHDMKIDPVTNRRTYIK